MVWEGQVRFCNTDEKGLGLDSQMFGGGGAQFWQSIVAKSHPKKGIFPLFWNHCQKPVEHLYSDR